MPDEAFSGLPSGGHLYWPLPQDPRKNPQMPMRSQDNQVHFSEAEKTHSPSTARTGRGLQLSFHPPWGDWFAPSWARPPRMVAAQETAPYRTLKSRGSEVEAGRLGISPEEMQQLSLQPGPEVTGPLKRGSWGSVEPLVSPQPSLRPPASPHQRLLQLLPPFLERPGSQQVLAQSQDAEEVTHRGLP